MRIKNVDRLIIGNLNINSIPNKFEQLKGLIQRKVDILVITETKIDLSFPKPQFCIDGYREPFRLDRNKDGGGILIYVRDDIPSKELDKHNFPHDIEGMFIEINLRNTKWLLFGTYHTPTLSRQTDEYYFDYVQRAIDIYSNFYTNFLLVGDFNSEDSEPVLSRFLEQYDLNNLVKEPTCFKNPDNPSCIDLFITNRPSCFQHTTTLSTGLSDFHKMTVTVLRAKYIKAKAKQILFRDYKKFDAIIFSDCLKEAISNQAIDSFKSFQDLFINILNKHAPLKKKFVRSNEAPYMTKSLRKAIMKRSELATRFHKTKKLLDQRAFKKQKNFVSRLYKKERRKFYANLDVHKITDNKLFWKTVQPLFSDKVKMKGKITLIHKKELISDETKVAETLNSYFENAAKNLTTENSFLINQTDKEDAVERAIEKFEIHPSILTIKEKLSVNSAFSFKPVDVQCVEKELEQLNPRKADTADNIPSKPLKDTSEACGTVLCNLINQAITNGEFPDELKLADVTPTFKKGDVTSVENYRPVSVLPAVSKVYERVIQSQILEYINHFLSSYLCGYRKGYSTQYALVSLIERWKAMLDKSGYAGAMLIDLSKAFDTLNHELLIAKLHAYGFDKKALKLIHSYLSNRWQRTKINNSFSSWTELILGVPQGSVLGPILFNIYINDLFWNNVYTDVCNFADDTTFYACDLSLESVLQRLEHDSLIAIEWFDNNYMKLNSDKCHLLISGFKHQWHWSQLGESKIWESTQEKLLGVTIDRNLNFEFHISKICQKANRKLSALGRVSNLMPLPQRKLLFNAFIMSQFAYCPLVWMFYDRNINMKINRLHERALRIVYKDDVSSFEELLRKDKGFTIHERNLQKLAIEVYKVKHGLAPLLMNDIFFKREQTELTLRKNPEFVIPRTRTVHKGDDSLRHLGPLIWNIIPEDIKSLRTLRAFKEKIKAWHPCKCPCRLCRPYIQGIGYINTI